MALLKDLIQPASLERCGDRSFPVLSMTMHDGIMLQSDRFKKSLVSTDQSAYKVVRRNQLVVGFPIDEGVLYIQQVVDAGIMSPAYDIWNVVETKVDLRYFELCLHSPQAMMFYKTNLRGTTARRRSLPKETLLSLPVPVPKMERQREIASTIGRLKELIELRQCQLRTLDTLIKARFVEMFGNFVFEKSRWPVCSVGDVAETVDPQPSHRTPPIDVDGIPYIGIAECNYQSRMIDFDSARKVGKNVLEEHIARYDLHSGDFIIGKIGTIGKPFFIPVERFYALSANTVLIQPNSKRIAPQFLFSIFQSEYMDRLIDAEKKSTSQPAFGIQKVRSIEIPLPPLGLQNRFSAFVSQVDKLKVVVQQALDKAQLLFESLMQQYFG